MFLFYVLYRPPPMRKRSLNSKKISDKTVPKKKHMQYSVKDFEKAVAAVTDDKKAVVVLQKNLTYHVKPKVIRLMEDIPRT